MTNPTAVDDHQNLVSKTYLSKAIDVFSDHDLDQLLINCRRNNAAASVTGALLYHNGYFMQLIEGPLGAITSISKHSYVLDGTLLVTEATVDTTGTALARFYYIEPITKDTTFNALARIQKRAEELRNRGQSRTGTKADEMAQKSYPTTTHARTIEFRIMNEVELNALS